jgi:hypothetical protein
MIIGIIAIIAASARAIVDPVVTVFALSLLLLKRLLLMVITAKIITD